jgi:chitin synthase
MAKALPSVSSKLKDGDTPIVVDTTKAQEDVDAAFKETVTRAITRVRVKDVMEKPTLDDQNKAFRTWLVAMWMLTNAGLAIAIEIINGLANSNALQKEQQLAVKRNIYLPIILYLSFALDAVRFTGVCDTLNIWYPLLSNYSSAGTISSGGTCSDAAAGTSCGIGIA